MNASNTCHIFERVEQKYLLTQTQYTQLRERIQGCFKVDAYGKSTIYSLYYDTPSRQLIRTSLEKPVYKEKLRLRSYGIPNMEESVFVELKKKYKGIVYKRRVSMPYRDASAYLAGIQPPQPQQITKEIDWFLAFYHPLMPSMLISYDRIALYGIQDPLFRITFDSHILWREDSLSLTDGQFGTSLLAPGYRLMEIKFQTSIPLWLCNIFSELAIYPTSFSKYGNAYAASTAKKQITYPTEAMTALTPIPTQQKGAVRYA